MSKRAYAVIVAGFFTVSMAYSIRYGYGMLLPEMLPDWGISKTQAGVIFAAYFVVYTIGTPVLGALSDLFNYRLLITVFAAVMGIGALMMAAVDNMIQACLVFSIAGLGHAACYAPVVALVLKWVPDHRRGTALSFVTMGVGSGVFLWGIFLPLIVSALNWRAAWIGLGFFALGVAALNLVLVRNPIDADRRAGSGDRRPEPFWTAYRALFKHKTFWIIGTAYLLMGFNVLVPFTFLPVYARESLHLTYAVSTRFVAIIALFSIVGQLILGTLSDKVGRVNVMMICGIIMGAACLGMLVSNSAWMLYVFTGFYGLGYGAVWPVYAAAASDFFSKSYTGSVVGLWTVFLGIGSIVSPVLCGWTIDTTGNYTWALMLGLFSGLFSTLLLLAIHRPTWAKTSTLSRDATGNG
jgi:MFS family permease